MNMHWHLCHDLVTQPLTVGVTKRRSRGEGGSWEEGGGGMGGEGAEGVGGGGRSSR